VVIPVTFTSKHPYTPDGRAPWTAESPWAEAMVTLGFVAAMTERVRIGVDVVPLIVTDPLTLAKQAATLDMLSNGRFELGIGSGWLVEEAAALGHPTDHRAARLAETIDVLRLAFGQPTFSFDGRYVRIPAVGINPRPPQGRGLPLWIGGKGDGVVRLAAERDAGLFLWVPSAAEVREQAKKLRMLAPNAAVAASLSLGEAGTRWREAIEALEDAGADLIVLMRRHDDGARGEFERIAKAFL
jgi:alkanesulfonate monooxygenase SsuD/methylene tetrahydromethanopterin reductase-like flavin-dependent oxidoreductase (luciferase family)